MGELSEHDGTNGDLPVERRIGQVVGDRSGPTLIAVAAIHGNETAGLHAGRRVLARLGRDDVALRGEMIVFAGNVGAVREKRRYRVRDMNRVWSEAHVEDVERRAASSPDSLDAEDQEQLELLAVIREAVARARGPVFLVDLHTTSAAGVPFVLFGDTLPQRHFASALPLPLIMGLEEQVDGVLSSYWTRHGCTTFAVEGGQHADPGSIDNLEAVLLVAAETAGIFARGSVAEVPEAARLLESRRGDLPRVMEVVSRHAIRPEDAFAMAPGFRNLDYARAQQLLARDRNGEIRAPRDGMVILPLYQGQGDDGFFWGRAVSSARMRVSERLRHLELERLLPLLPGVTRDPSAPHRLVVDTRIARLYPLDVFHILGYRRIRKDAARMTVERQPD
ncbi:MAG: succinylglutamate desuccinylase/aspartoacylase family protein [Deltaproteobacteria bacterium]|nr:succinylglutamate desuccinylase/aspartoacylase family protein [Deltaproteobacteria bacterium]